MKFWNDPKVIGKTALLTTPLLEAANVQQLWRMWHEKTAAGQSMTGWMCVGLALLLWCNFYRVCCPNEKWALRGTVMGVAMNAAVILTVIYFRYGMGR